MSDAPIMAALRPAWHRVERACDVCGQLDDHPRHVHANNDGTDSIRHMDCCRSHGCPDGSCAKVTAGAENLRGMDLIAFLHGGTAPAAPGTVAHSITPTAPATTPTGGAV